MLAIKFLVTHSYYDVYGNSHFVCKAFINESGAINYVNFAKKIEAGGDICKSRIRVYKVAEEITEQFWQDNSDQPAHSNLTNLLSFTKSSRLC